MAVARYSSKKILRRHPKSPGRQVVTLIANNVETIKQSILHPADKNKQKINKHFLSTWSCLPVSAMKITANTPLLQCCTV